MKRYHYEPCPRCRERGRDTRGDNLVSYYDGSGHCFSCGYHRFPKYAALKSINKVKDNVPKSLLPFDFTREVPATALKWLLQYGLPYTYWKESIGYSPKEERLVFTVGNPTQFSIGRYVGMRDMRKWYVWGDSHRHTEAIGNGPVVVLVEDLISAHKVGQVTTAIPLFGTKIHPCHLYYLINDIRPVILWLDKDQEYNVKKQALQLQSLINREVRVVSTDKDPKYLTEKEINEQLGAVMYEPDTDTCFKIIMDK